MKAKTKKIIAGTAALSLVAAVAIGGTYAYLTRETEQRANNFTFASDAVDAMLTEPDWDGVVDYEYDDDGNITPIYNWFDDDQNPDTPPVPVYGFEDGDMQKPVTDKTKADDPKTDRPRKDSTDDTFKPTYGDEQAQNMIPGQPAKKNPIITNTGITDEWVAAKVTFVYGEGSANAGKALTAADWAVVKENIVVDFNTAVSDVNGYWTLVGAADTVSQTYYYSKILPKGTETAERGVTEPIFQTVTLKYDADNEVVDRLNQMGGIAIYIEGYAIQSDAYADFAAWKGSNAAVFTHTPTEAAAPDTGVEAPGIFPKETTATTTTTTAVAP